MDDTSAILLRLGEVAGKQEGMEKALSSMKSDINELRDGQKIMVDRVNELGEHVKLALNKMQSVEERCSRRHPKGTGSVMVSRPSPGAMTALTKNSTPLGETLGDFFARVGVKVLEGALIAMGLALFYFAAKLVGAI